MDASQATPERYTAHMETRWTAGPQLPDEQWQRLLHLLFKPVASTDQPHLREADK